MPNTSPPAGKADEVSVVTDSRFPQVTLGYAGFSHPDATLNSRFYAALWSRPDDARLAGGRIHFPQRMPRVGFFEELIAAETPAAARLLTERRELIRRNARALDAARCEADPVFAANLAGLSGRYGIVDAPNVSLRSLPLDDDEHFRLALNLSAIETNKSVSRGEAGSLEDLEFLCRAAEERAGLDENLRAHLWNRYLVTQARHARGRPDSPYAERLAGLLSDYLGKSKPVSFAERVSHSILWRGYAMAKRLDDAGRGRALDESERLALAAEPGSEAERVIKDENLVTLLQTLTKWRGRADASQGLACLQTMIRLDPSDSTAYSEIGLVHIKEKRWQAAREAFAAAARLGPPALAMNLFFRGEAEKALSLEAEAEQSWLASARLDRTGLSPRLALMEYYKASGSPAKGAPIRDEILASEPLRSQLDARELEELVKN